MNPARSTALAAAAIQLSLALACGAADDAAPDGSGGPNVLIVTLDTTRADRLGCYGYAAAATSTLDALAARGVRFERAYAHVPLTLPSHATLFTGRYPRETGVRVNVAQAVPSGVPTLAEAFRERGYRTGAFVSAYVLDATFGLDRGFDHYDDEMGGADSARFDTERSGDRVTDAALAWLDSEPRRPFLAWVHYFDPHAPYAPPPPFRERFKDAYDGEIAFVDEQVGRLVAWLDRMDVRDSTLVIVAGDHGEAFGEHGENSHGFFVYEPTMRVPLLLSWPGRLPEGRVVAEPARLVDVYPTIHELLGWKQGDEQLLRSLLPRVEGRASAPSVYGESWYPFAAYEWAPLRSLIAGDWKYIEAPLPELYDLASDPQELANLATERPDRAAELRAALLEQEAAMLPVESQAAELDADALEKLRSLGYVGGSAPAPDATIDLSQLADPKSMLDVYLGHTEANGLLDRGRIGEAAKLLESLVARSPESAELNDSLGRAYLTLDRPRDAQRAYEIALRRSPSHPERLYGLAESVHRQGRFDDAERLYRAALDGRPDLGEAHRGLVLVYAAQNRFEEALRHAEQHVALDPASANAQVNLATVSMRLNRVEQADAALGRALEVEPRNVQAHQLRWQLRMRSDGPAAALQALAEARSELPDDWSLVCAEAWILATAASRTLPSAAERSLEVAARCVELGPDQARSHETLAAARAASGQFTAAAEAARRAAELTPAGQERTRLERVAGDYASRGNPP